MSVKQISVFLENKPGTLEDMTELLAENGIDMRALSLAEAEGFGIVRIIVDDAYKTMTLLRDAELVSKITPVVAVAIPDEPGGLNNVLRAFRNSSVNVDYMYAFLGGKETEHAYMIFKVHDISLAEEALRKSGIRLVDQDEIATL